MEVQKQAKTNKIYTEKQWNDKIQNLGEEKINKITTLLLSNQHAGWLRPLFLIVASLDFIDHSLGPGEAQQPFARAKSP